jgi:hypothetical protein
VCRRGGAQETDLRQVAVRDVFGLALRALNGHLLPPGSAVCSVLAGVRGRGARPTGLKIHLHSTEYVTRPAAGGQTGWRRRFFRPHNSNSGSRPARTHTRALAQSQARTSVRPRLARRLKSRCYSQVPASAARYHATLPSFQIQTRIVSGSARSGPSLPAPISG